MNKKIVCVLAVIGMVFLGFVANNVYFTLSNDTTTSLSKGSVVSFDVSMITSEVDTFNRYTIKYSSDIYIKGTITYKIDDVVEKERFFLEPDSSGIFSSFVSGYIDDRFVNQSDIVSIEFENIDNSLGNFDIDSFELVLYPAVDDLVASISGNLADDDYVNHKTIFIGNDNLKLGISLKYGGSINYISGNTEVFTDNYANINLINRADNGRLIQQCIYGNQIYSGNSDAYLSGTTDNIGGMYNPIQGGNVDHDSKIVDIGISDDKKTIVVKTKPSLWRVTNSDYMNDFYDYYEGYTTDSYMLTKYTIYDKYISVENSYIDFTDNVNNTDNDFSRSESPSVYAISALNEFYTYDMQTNKLKSIDVGETDSNGFKQLNPDSNNDGQAIYSYWGGYFSTSSGVTEGIGIYHPDYDGTIQYMMGFIAGDSGSKSSLDVSTSFFSSIIHLKDGKIGQFKKFSYDYVITVGNINDVSSIMDVYRSDHSYTLMVDPNGGSFSNSTDVTTLEPKLLAYWANWNNIGAAVRNGYKLLGYYTSKSDGVMVYDSFGVAVNGIYWKVNDTSLVEQEYQYIANKDLIVYAQWTPINYAIEYNLDGGIVTGNPSIYNIESETFLLNNPTKENYNFVGWRDEVTGVVLSEVKVEKGTTGDKFYTAIFSEIVDSDVFTITSDKYVINEEEKYIVITDFDEETIKNNITVSDNVLLVLDLVNYKLQVMDGSNQLLKEFDLVGISSSDYDLSSDYIYVGTSEFDLNKINVLNGSKVINDNKVQIKYNDYLIKELEVLSVNFDSVLVSDKLIKMEGNFTYDEFVNNITVSDGLIYKVYSDGSLVTSGNMLDGMVLKIYYNGQEIDKFDVMISNYDLSFDESLYVDEDNKYIKYLDYLVTVSELVSKVNLTGIDTRMVVYTNNKYETEKSSEDVIASGNVLVIYDGETVMNEYTISVIGDLNGDGEVGLIDLVQMRKHMVEWVNPSTGIVYQKTGVYYYAMDINKDNKISLIDLVRMRKIIVERDG